jgi:hypothetical protein
VSVVESLSPASASRFTAARDAADSLRGEKRLACAVLASGIREKDIPFVQSEDFRFWALLAGYSPSEAQRRALKVVVPSAVGTGLKVCRFHRNESCPPGFGPIGQEAVGNSIEAVSI